MEEDKHLTKRQRKKLAKENKQKERESKERVNSLKTYGVWALVILAAVFGGFKLIKWINTPSVEVVSEPIEVTDSDWVKGASENAKITIIEFSDFQCPACQSYYPVIDQISEEYSENVRVVYRHYPLVSIHPNAFDAARASEAAGKQGKFWEMHDLLFEKQEEWSSEGNPSGKFKEYASELELDLEQFDNDFGSQEIEDRINEHIFLGNRLGINSTPSFVLNDRLIQNPRGYEGFKTLIDDSLNSE